MGGVRHSYIHDLLMEIKREDQKFQVYKPGGQLIQMFVLFVANSYIANYTPPRI